MTTNNIDTESEFAPADDVLAALAAIPGINDDAPERDEAREQMERAHRIGLATLRQAAALTQSDVAAKMGVRQTSVSRLESRPDILLSTLKGYLDAVGAEAVITITLNGVEHKVALDELVQPRAEVAAL